MKRITVIDGRVLTHARDDEEVIDLQAFVQKAYSGFWWGKIFSYASVRLLTYHADYLPRRWLMQVLLRILTFGPCEIENENGEITRVTFVRLALDLWRWPCDKWRQRAVLQSVKRKIAELKRLQAEARAANRMGPESPLYLKMDLLLSVTAGGSVSHMAGVVNNLGQFGPQPMVLAPSANPLVSTAIPYQSIQPSKKLWNFRELPAQAFNFKAIHLVHQAMADRKPGWIYHRYCLHGIAGLWLARHYGVPLVLEYNGSEVWIGENWGSGLTYGALGQQVEQLNLDGADLIVVVSQALQDELLQRGINQDKILVNPNGVDVERFHPMVDAWELKQSLGWSANRVIGFIGTFGRWHGADVLVEAFVALSRSHERFEDVRLLMIGDGQMRQYCEERAQALNIASKVHFTGAVPQVEGPRWLAACDCLVAPHVPNVDHSQFFGSPTKLFEYMAMGRPIVASKLGQMDELLQHKRNAWLVEPGNSDALFHGLSAVMSDNVLAQQMGRQARVDVVEKYTWLAHTQRIVNRLVSTCG